VNRQFRLTRSTDFKRVRRYGKSYAHPLCVLVAIPNETEQVRVGVTASRSVGNAVKRNRAKRRLRAATAAWLPELAPGWDFILIARSAILEAPFPTLIQTIAELLHRARILSPHES